MSDIITLCLMIAIPIFLYLGLKSRVKKDVVWKKYLAAAGGVFVLLIFVTKM